MELRTGAGTGGDAGGERLHGNLGVSGADDLKEQSEDTVTTQGAAVTSHRNRSKTDTLRLLSMACVWYEWA